MLAVGYMYSSQLLVNDSGTLPDVSSDSCVWPALEHVIESNLTSSYPTLPLSPIQESYPTNGQPTSAGPNGSSSGNNNSNGGTTGQIGQGIGNTGKNSAGGKNGEDGHGGGCCGGCVLL